MQPGRSAAVVGALEEVGAVALGKTNMDQFATGFVGTRAPYGIPRSVSDDAAATTGSASPKGTSGSCRTGELGGYGAEVACGL